MSQPSTMKLDKRMEDLYAKKQYKDAMDLLFKHKGVYAPGQFHETLGILFLKDGNLGAGRYNLEKAMALGRTTSQGIKGLRYAKSQVEVRDLSRSNVFEDQLFDKVTSFSYEFPLILTLLGLLLYIVLGRLGKIRSAALHILLITLTAAPLVFWGVSEKLLSPAVIIVETSLREGPSKVFEETQKIGPGAKVIIGKKSLGWAFIRYPHELIGWVKLKDIGTL